MAEYYGDIGGNNRIRVFSSNVSIFSDFEFQKAMDNNFVPVNVGPRILRTETAVVCGVSLAQQLWGDLN